MSDEKNGVPNETGRQGRDVGRYGDTADPLARLVSLVKEVMSWHRDKESADYNECERSPCMWCHEAQQAIDRLPNEKTEAASDALLDCPDCGGQGRADVTGMSHHPSCDGSCRNCPIPVQTQEPCATCGGSGQVRPNIEMGLCEAEHVMLRPNRLYRFVVIPGCDRCKALAAAYPETEDS